MEEIFKVLAGMGDMATIGFAFAIWKLERRIFIMEQKWTDKK